MKFSLRRHFLADNGHSADSAFEPLTMSDENQHWVPKFLIKNFADHDGRVFCLDLHTDRVTKPPPKQAASEKGFNIFQVAGETVSFEDRLEKIETRAAPVLKRIINDGQLTSIDVEDRRRVAEFIAAQSFRTKAFYEGLSVKMDRNAFASKFSLLLDGIFAIAAEIAHRHWALMVTSDDTFYLGDNPTVLQRTDNLRDGSNLGFDVSGVEAFLPLAPHCAIYMPCRATSEDRIARYEAALDLHRTVRSAVLRGHLGGSKALRMAQLVISRLDPLYQALKTGVALPAQPDNVENLNYLQCSWAHEAVYSNRRNFAFARRVFSENPQYRGVPTTSLIEMTALVPDQADARCSS
jgi:hypothetical protein